MKLRFISVILVMWWNGIVCQSLPSVEIRINLGGYPTSMSKKAIILSHAEIDNLILMLKNTDTPIDVHMPFWRLLKTSIKGSLVDGPLWTSIYNKMIGIQLSEPDEYAHLQPSHIKYHDDWADYSTNEPTLDGSAELLLILTKLSQK